MAKKVAEVKVVVNNGDAIRSTKKFGEEITRLTEKLAFLGEKLNKQETWDPNETFDSIKKELNKTQKNLDENLKKYEASVKRIGGIDDILANLEGATYNVLTRTRTTLTNSLKNARRNSEEEIKDYEEQAKRLQKVRDEIAKRDIDMRGGMTEQKAAEVVSQPQNYSTTELKQALEVTKKLRDMQVMGSKQWKEYADQVENANRVLKDFTDQTKLQAMNNQFKQLGSLSTSALSEQKKYWQEMVDGAAAGSKELAAYESRLKKVIAEEQKRSKEKAGKVMTNLTDYSVNEIKEAIKATEQLRDAQKPGSKAWAEYAAQVKNANDYLDSFKNKAQFEAMNTQFKQLGTLSANALAEQKKYWQAMVDGAANGSKELEQYRKKLAEVTAEEQKRTAASVRDVMKNPTKYSVTEIREAIKATEQLRDAQQPGSKAWKDYAEQVENANRVMDSFKDKAKLEGMTAQYRNLSTLSKSALSEQKRFWQAMIDGAAKGSKELELYESRLRLVINEENRRTRDQGKELTSSVLGGSWKGTVGEAKEAVKLLKEYKDTLNTTDTAGIKRVDKAISELNSKTKLAEAGFKSTTDALNALVRQTKNLGYGNFKGSIAELEEMRRKLLTIRDTQDKVLSARDRDRLTKAIQRVDKELGLAKGELLDINYVLANMKDTPLKTLERAAAQLQAEIRECSENTKDFTDKAAQLRRVNAQVDKLKKSFKEKENVIMRTAKRLMAYVAVYGGFNFVIGKVRELTQANLQLSDSYADIQKTTGLTSEQVKDLSKSIDSIDTRTTQQQLHELAATAGQLGLKSQTDILGFVKASNMISVSLNELGAEGTSSLMKIATLTGEASEGTEQALLKIGSAINELTANSAATAGPIVDLMNRMGGVAAQANLTSAQMAAIGATANALGQSMEITGTSMNKFLTTLMSSSDDIAYALNMDAKALRDLLDSGKTMEAMISVFERMKNMGGLESLAGVMGDLGSEGARMTQVLSAMASRVDFLKAQVELSTEAYEDASSIQNEYNIKNENALAIWQRIGNMLKELLVNNFFVDILTSISRGIHNVLSLVIQSENFFKILASSIAAVTAALYANSAAWVQNLNAMGFKAGVEALWGRLIAVWDTLATTIKGGTTAMWGATKAAWAAAEGSNVFKKALDLLTKGLKNLAAFLSRNWLTVAIAAIAGLVAWLVTAATRVSELTRATARYRREVEEEKNAVDALFLSLQRNNLEMNNKAKIIEQINRKYGDYLGFMLDERDSADKLAAAHKLINSELEKRMALNLQSTLQGKASNEYASKYEEETSEIERAIKGEGLFNTDQFKGKVSAGEVNAFISKLVNDAVTNAIDSSGDYRKLNAIDMEKFGEEMKKALSDKFDYTIDNKDGSKATVKLGESLYNKLEDNIENLLEARIDYMENTLDAERAADLEMGRITTQSVKDRMAMLKATENEISKLENTKVEDSWTEEQKREHYSKLLDQYQDYIAQTDKIRKEIPEAERDVDNKVLAERKRAYQKLAKEIAPLAGEDPWGKNMDVTDWKDFADIVTNLDTSSANALAAAYKKITEDTAKIPSNVKQFYKMFEGTGLETKLKLQSPDDIAKQVHRWAEQIKEKLKTKYGRNTSLGFIFESEGSGGDKSAEKEARKELNAVLAALEEHYLKRKTIIQQAYLDEKISGAEMNRQIADNDEEFRRARIELRKELVGEANTFNQSLYPELKGKDIQRTAKFLQQIGDVVTDGIRKNIQKDEVEIRDGAIKLRQAFEDELLKRDLFGKFENEFRESLDKLELLSSDFERTTAQWMKDTLGVTDGMAGLNEENQKKRLQALIKLSEKSYQINEQGMVDELSKHKEFAIWVQNLDANSRALLLQNLRDYYDQRLLVQKQYTERLGREMESWYEQSGQQKDYEATKTKIENRSSENEILSGFGVEKDYGDEEKNITDEFVNEYNRLDALREKAMEHRNTLKEGSQEYIATTALITQYEMEQNALLAQGQRDLTQVYMEEWTKRAERWGEWGEMFGDYLGEQVMLEKQANDARVRGDEEAAEEIEKRQKKNKEELIKTALTKVVDLAAVWAKEFALKMMYNSLMEASDQQRTLSEVTNQGKATTLSILLDALKGQAHEHGKGLPGLVTGAIIFAATMALQAMAKSAIANMFPEAADETNKANPGRLATGMLTYAEGNYPVLGNDGNVYNAKYEGAGMKTGIYRGGAHFGIFSEKKPEAIIDGDTTQRLIMNHPDIWKAIVTLSKNGRLDSGFGMRTFATGNIDQLARQAQEVEATATADNSAQMAQMQATMAATQQTLAQLTQVLANGITANLDMYGENGAYKKMKKAEKFANRVGYK